MDTLATESAGESLAIRISTDLHTESDQAFTIGYSQNPAENIIYSLPGIPLSALDAGQLFEGWQGVADNSAKQAGGWQVYCNDQYLIAALPPQPLDHLGLDQATEKAYSLIFRQLNACGYPYLLRTWNFFPEITGAGCAHRNNYQQFCSGRARAYAKMTALAQPYPAATVIGSGHSDLYIYFIAARTPGLGIENSRQVSAFEYPSCYSQDPPLFSRALLHRNLSQEILFISGTASITGHSTRYDGDISRQTEVCLANITNLVNTASHEHQFTKLGLKDFSFIKVYIKDPDDIDNVRACMQQMAGPGAAVYYLRGDMCRSNLLVEIEALAIHTYG